MMVCRSLDCKFELEWASSLDRRRALLILHLSRHSALQRRYSSPADEINQTLIKPDFPKRTGTVTRSRILKQMWSWHTAFTCARYSRFLMKVLMQELAYSPGCCEQSVLTLPFKNSEVTFEN